MELMYPINAMSNTIIQNLFQRFKIKKIENKDKVSISQLTVFENLRKSARKWIRVLKEESRANHL